MAKSPVRPLVVWGLGLAGFLVVFFLVGHNIWLSLAGAVGGLIIGGIITGRKPKPVGELLADGTNRLDYEMALKEAWAKHRLLTNEAFRVTNAGTRKKIDAVADVVRRILEDVKADPSDFRAARQFMEYYLDATVKIVKRYVELSDKGALDPEVQASLVKVEETLDSMKVAYEKQLRILLENDKLDLDTELTVLKRTIELEGLGQDVGSKTSPQ